MCPSQGAKWLGRPSPVGSISPINGRPSARRISCPRQGREAAMADHFVGIFEGGYDPAVGIVSDGKLLAYAEEERFIRNKHANGWYPTRSLRFCLDQAGIGPGDVSALAINWDVPSYTNGAMRDFFQQMRREWPVDQQTINWQNGVLRHFSEESVKARHATAWRRAFGAQEMPPIWPIPHHYVHAMHAFLQSPFDDAICLTVDGSGDQFCTV